MLQVMVYDRDFVRRGALGAWQSLDINLIRNGISECKITAPANHPKMIDISGSGARLVVTDDETDHQLFSGTVRSYAGSGPGDEQITVTAQSDHRALQYLLAWPSPAAGLDAQQAYRRVTGYTLEAMLKILVTENVARAGLPITVAPNLSRGPGGSGEFRFSPILEALQERLNASDLTVTMVQDGPGILLDVAQSREIRKELAVGTGNLVSYDWNIAASDGTRAVVAGQGDGAARVLRQAVIDGRELARNTIEEVFVDARDVDINADLIPRGMEKLEETRQKSGLSLELTESPSFHFGVQYGLGDLVTVRTAAGPITDRIQQVRITADRESGVQVTPTAGERSDDPDMRLIRFIKRFAGKTSLLERR